MHEGNAHLWRSTRCQLVQFLYKTGGTSTSHLLRSRKAQAPLIASPYNWSPCQGTSWRAAHSKNWLQNPRALFFFVLPDHSRHWQNPISLRYLFAFAAGSGNYIFKSSKLMALWYCAPYTEAAGHDMQIPSAVKAIAISCLVEYRPQ